MNFIMFTCLAAGTFLPATAQTFGITYTTETQYAPTEGNANWCNLLRTDYSLPIYKNGEFNIASVHIYKTNKQRVVNDLTTFSNIEEENTPFAIALLGYTQTIGASALFFGIRNMNEDYFASPTTSLFTNSSCGIFPTISTNYPIANYPLSGLCLDYKVKFGQWGVKSSLYNGVGYNRWSRDDNPFILNFKNDGVFRVIELDYQTDYGNYFCGVAVHNRMFLCDKNVAQESETTTQEYQKKTSATWWSYIEQRLWTGKGSEINLLIQYSRNTSATNFCNQYFGLGASWSRLDNKQREHNAGIIFSATEFRGTYEMTTEVTYRYLLSSSTYLQPTVHFIQNGTGFQSVFLLRFSYAIDWAATSKI